MKFQVGDKVIIHHSDEEGEVVEIIDREMVMVEVRGVRFPAYIDQLDFPYFKRFTEKKPELSKPGKKYIDQVPAEKSKSEKRVEDGVWLFFLPVMEEDEFGDEIVQSLKVHLVNHLGLGLKFHYRLTYFGRTDLELQNEIIAFKEFYLHDIPFENLNDSPAFEFEFSLLTPAKNKAEYFESAIKLKAKQVFAKIEEIRKRQEASFSYRLFEKYPDKAETYDEPIADNRPNAAKIYDFSDLRQNLPPARQELDLHIEKLTDQWNQLSALDMLTLQLQTFEHWLDLAIAHRQSTMVVIHGVGSGKLRDEIHEILRMKKEVKFFVNRYHERYGYGATEIYFQF